MSYRRQPSKPTAVLWMLVAVADVVLVLASAGVLILAALALLAVIAAATVGTWRHLRRQAEGADVTAPVVGRVPVRRS